MHLSGYLVPEDTTDGEFGDYVGSMSSGDDSDEEEDSDDGRCAIFMSHKNSVSYFSGSQVCVAKKVLNVWFE